MNRRFKFEMGGSYTFFDGPNIGSAILAFIRLFGSGRLEEVEAITEEPYAAGERP